MTSLQNATHQTQLTTHQTQTSGAHLKQYINASNECDFAKKRLKMLARVEAHNEAKIRLNQKSLERIQNLRSMKQDQSFEKEELEKAKKINGERQRQLNMKNKSEMKQKLRNVLEEIEAEKVEDRNKVREQSKSIALKIQQLKQKQLNEKKHKRNQVIKREQESKENYQNYFIAKKDQFIQRNQAEVSFLSAKKNNKKKEINKMAGIEEKILERQQEIKKEFESVQMKLSGVYNIEPLHMSKIIQNSRVTVHECVAKTEGQKSCSTNLSQASKV